MFILTSLTLPPESATAFSRAGANCLHGPHQGAQKSTSTGWRAEAAMTSCPKEAAVTSFTAEAVPPLKPLPLDIIRSVQRIHFYSQRWGAARSSAISCEAGRRLKNEQSLL